MIVTPARGSEGDHPRAVPATAGHGSDGSGFGPTRETVRDLRFWRRCRSRDRATFAWGSRGREFESPQPDGRSAGQSRSHGPALLLPADRPQPTKRSARRSRAISWAAWTASRRSAAAEDVLRAKGICRRTTHHLASGPASQVLAGPALARGSHLPHRRWGPRRVRLLLLVESSLGPRGRECAGLSPSAGRKATWCEPDTPSVPSLEIGPDPADRGTTPTPSAVGVVSRSGTVAPFGAMKRASPGFGPGLTNHVSGLAARRDDKQAVHTEAK